MGCTHSQVPFHGWETLPTETIPVGDALLRYGTRADGAVLGECMQQGGIAEHRTYLCGPSLECLREDVRRLSGAWLQQDPRPDRSRRLED